MKEANPAEAVWPSPGSSVTLDAMNAAAFRRLRAGVWMLAGTGALACAWKSEPRWLLAGVAMVFYARCAWFGYLALRREAYERNPTLVIANAERVYVVCAVVGVCLCVVSLLRGEGGMGVVVALFVIGHTTFHLYLARMWNRPAPSLGGEATPQRTGQR